MKSSSQTPREALAVTIHGARAKMVSTVAAQVCSSLGVMEARNSKG